MFAAKFIANICDEINKNYRAIVKNMPATEEQKSILLTAPVTFKANYIRLGNFGQVQYKWIGLINGKAHQASSNKAIQSAEKSKVNKFNGEQFATIKISNTSIIIEVTSKVQQKLKELSKKL